MRETEDRCLYGYGRESAKDVLFVDIYVCGILEWVVRLVWNG
jgi:hypothetical protein